ncbi:trypsin-like peptidase domain-containing protein [Streptomyces polygonati]|uniref:Trypsin-like peptidase domain-containing protein n=1 Tax=Streptomyces polygonati TaxID=1617087 RepID=A0ABV8HNQ6_9ACTN
MAGGAQREPGDAAEILLPLASAATVRIHSAESGNPLLGSGFFVAPNWVLTCAHVALAGQEATVGAAARKVSIGYGDRMLTGVVEWADPDASPGPGRWPAPDLALVRLLDQVDHPCVWLSERTAKGYTTNQVAYFGWVPMDGEVYPYNGRCTISGQLGAGSGGALRLSNEDEMPSGLSGGPVVDLARGEVIGVLKSRRSGKDGGLAVGIQQLRHLPAAAGPADDDLYHRVMAAHDLYHADRHGFVARTEPTWTDAQSDIGAMAGRALTPGQRTRLLGLLAQLPPPAGTRSLERIVTEVRGAPAQGLPQAPRAWRDGLGLLYDLRRGGAELEAVLRYAVHAATAERPHPAEDLTEPALWQWAEKIAAEAETPTRPFRSALLTERRARLRLRESPSAASVAPARRRTGPEVLLEIFHRGWEPGRYDWQVCVVPETGEVVPLGEGRDTDFADLPASLAEPLTEAFRRCDERDYAAALQLALPDNLVDLAVDVWRLGSAARPVGAVRPVVVRRSHPPDDADPAVAEERVARWNTLHKQWLAAEVLDCDEVALGSVPDEDELRSRPRQLLPVLCRSGPDAPEALRTLVRSGYPIALWRREPVGEETVCADFHRGTSRTVRVARTAAGLPAALSGLRAGVADGVPETYWSTGLTLLYDDPTRPLPGAGELLENP